MEPTLVILAAGMASRYGSMKQIQGFGPGGETIMDYSIYDSIRAGFGKVVFIIRREFAEDFKNIFDPKLKDLITTEYVFQDMESFTEGVPVPETRTKPWGTAHAVLCAMDTVKEPFAVINADDFYGRPAFQDAFDFLKNDSTENTQAIIGYDLLTTLSEHGTVNRGVCTLDELGNLVGITERLNISLKDGKIICEDNMEPHELSRDTKVSLNFWCFHPSFFSFTQKVFREFLQKNIDDPKAEFFIPIAADRFIKEGGTIEVIPTTAEWFGVTYKEDAPQVEKSLNELVKKGEYPERLWETPIA